MKDIQAMPGEPEGVVFYPDPPKPKQTVKITARCIEGHTEILTQAQLDEANRQGVAICSICSAPMTVQRAVVS